MTGTCVLKNHVRGLEHHTSLYLSFPHLAYHGKRSKHNSSDTDSSLFEWEEEATLFSELMEEE